MRTIIGASDLDQLTFKTILTVLTAKYGDLTEKKDFLKSKLTEILSEDGEDKESAVDSSTDANNVEEKNEEVKNEEDSESAEDAADKSPKEEESEESNTKLEDDGMCKIQSQVFVWIALKLIFCIVGDLSKENLEVQQLLLESYKYGTRGTRTTRSRASPATKKTEKKKTNKRKSKGSSDEDGSEPEKKKRRPKVNKPKILSPGLAGS